MWSRVIIYWPYSWFILGIAKALFYFPHVFQKKISIICHLCSTRKAFLLGKNLQRQVLHALINSYPRSNFPEASCDVDPCYFGTDPDPDPQIRTTEFRIRIFSSVGSFQDAYKNNFLPITLWRYVYPSVIKKSQKNNRNQGFSYFAWQWEDPDPDPDLHPDPDPDPDSYVPGILLIRIRIHNIADVTLPS